MLTLGVGVIWFAYMFNRVGFRRRDALVLLIPPWWPWIVLAARCVWRYTDARVSWTPREDRPSRVLSPGGRQLAIGASVVTILFVLVLVIAQWPDIMNGLANGG